MDNQVRTKTVRWSSETQQVRNAGITETLGTARADAAGPANLRQRRHSGDGGPVSSITGRGDLSVRKYWISKS